MHDAFGVGKSAVADAVIQRIKLDDVDAGDDGVEHIGALRDQRPRCLDASHISAIFVAIAVGGRNDDGLGGAAANHRRSLRECSGSHSNRSGSGCNERPTTDLAHRYLLFEEATLFDLVRLR